MIRHFSHIFLADAETFIPLNLSRFDRRNCGPEAVRPLIAASEATLGASGHSHGKAWHPKGTGP